jgi:hypothetical protein
LIFSARNNVGIDEAFQKIAEMAVSNMAMQPPEQEGFEIDKDTPGNSGGFTCWGSFKSKLGSIFKKN